LGSGGTAPHTLLVGLDGDEWSASCTGHFHSEERPWYPSDRRLGGPQGQSRPHSKDKNSLPLGSPWEHTVLLTLTRFIPSPLHHH